MYGIIDAGFIEGVNLVSIKKQEYIISKVNYNVKNITTSLSTLPIINNDILCSGNDKAYTSFTTGNGLLAGGTYINTTENIFENDVTLFSNDIVVSKQRTVDGKFSFGFLNKSLNYDIKATPTNLDFQPRIISNMKPVDDNSCYKFLFYCFHDKEYRKGVSYTIRTVAYDTKGELRYNLDNAPSGVSIDEKTGVITMTINENGSYDFTANCSDLVLGITKSTIISFDIIDYNYGIVLDGVDLKDSKGFTWDTKNTTIIKPSNYYNIENGYIFRQASDISPLGTRPFRMVIDFMFNGDNLSVSGFDKLSTLFSQYNNGTGYSSGIAIYRKENGEISFDIKDLTIGVFSSTAIARKIENHVRYRFEVVRVGKEFTLKIDDYTQTFVYEKVANLTALTDMYIGGYHDAVNNRVLYLGNISIYNFGYYIL